MNRSGSNPRRNSEERANYRRRAAAEAGHASDAGTARAFLADLDGAVRATALGALVRAGALTNADVSLAARDTDPRVRMRLAQPSSTLVSSTLGGFHPAQLLDDVDPGVVEMAAWACGEREGSPEVVHMLARIADMHDDALCRESAIAALGALGDEAGLAAILRATLGKAAIRRRAVLALAPFDGPEVEAALRRSLEDRDWQVRQAAEDLS